MPNEAHIIVACGGSGIKTLVRLNQLLSQDDYWRQRLAHDVYYVVVDTDVEEMREFHDAVARDLTGAPDPLHITSVSLAEGEANLQPMINKYMIEPFRDGRNTAGRDRLLEHWWHRNADSPFSAPSVIGLTKGAGQCPPVSYFLAWSKLKTLEERFDDLIKAIQKRQGGFGKADVLNFIIVCSLAGGTGRGSWEIIAFKLRDMFRRYNKVPKPRAFLFDAGIFDDLYRAKPGLRLPMQVNALAGISQLSCWVENRLIGQQTPGAAYRYHLPSLENPEEEEADVLQADLYQDHNEASPVNHAYLIFDTNGVASLENHLQYYEMAGAAIYAALSKSSIAREEINSNRSYVGLATATFEVDATSLRRYFEAQAYCKAAKMLMQTDDARVDAKVAEFLKATQLEVNVTVSDPGTCFKPDPQGLFLQKVLARLDAKSRDRIGALTAALDRDDVDETKRMVKSALLVQEDLVRACFAEVLRDLKLDPPAQMEAMARELFEETRSAASVQAFVDEVQAALDVELEEMPAEMPLTREDPLKLAEEFASRPFPIGFRHYNEAECKTLLNVTRRGLFKANYGAVKKVLGEHYAAWSKQMERLRANAADLSVCFHKLQRKFAKERDSIVPNSDRAFEELFTDPAEPEKALGPRFSATKFYRRTLKPAMAEGGDMTMLEPVVHLKKELFDVTFDALLADRVSESEAFDTQKRLAARLERAIRNTVALPDDFITGNFSLRKVIDGLRKAWRDRLSLGMTADRRVSLEKHFAEIFGFQPKRVDDGGELSYDFPDTDEFIFAMAASLAKTCKPYWQLQGAEGQKTNVMLFVPTAKDVAAATNAVRDLLESTDIVPEVFPQLQTQDPANPSTANPFMLLAYATGGADDIDEIASLNYYKDGEVLKVMKSVEDLRGETIFSGGENGGLGYVDPLYLTNETIRDLRWRPWARGQAEAVEQQHTADAILYALFPGEAAAAGICEIHARLDNLGWRMPLIEQKPGNRYALGRLPLVLDGEKIRDDPATHRLAGWDVGKPVATAAGLHNVWAAIHGDGECPRPEWRKRILEESNVFWTVVLTRIGAPQGTPTFRDMLKDYQDWLGKKFREFADDDANKPIWGKLLERVTKMIESV